MELLRELMRVQHEQGWLDHATLRRIAQERCVPLYRLEGLVSFYPAFRRSPRPRMTLHACRDISCAMAGCGVRNAELQRHLAEVPDVEFREVSCLGRCDQAPAVELNGSPLGAASIAEILASIHGPSSPGQEVRRSASTWKCDPYTGVEDRYATVKGLGADVAAECIDRLGAAGLRGMGGAGFPTARKWDLVRREPVSPKYVICNADESEPGTFKDREILAQLPHLVIEGMLLAARTIGAEQGIVYLRHEYEPEGRRLEAALRDARFRGILGPNAAGSGQPFDIEVFVSPGGYILGEETALLEALEDKRGEPRIKPPYPGTHGLWGRPTLINNVETFALATAIVARGAEWWIAQGRPGFAGMKFVSVSGDVRCPGVYEIPVGMPVRELIQLAGGMQDGTRLRAFLPGGASSNFLAADKVDTPLDFEAMKSAGSMLGTGAVIVISDRHDLLALATNIVRFFRNESCGKCVPCRLGSEHAVQLLEEIQSGQRESADLVLIPELAKTLEQTSICGLGQVALNSVVSLRTQVLNAEDSL